MVSLKKDFSNFDRAPLIKLASLFNKYVLEFQELRGYYARVVNHEVEILSSPEVVSKIDLPSIELPALKIAGIEVPTISLKPPVFDKEAKIRELLRKAATGAIKEPGLVSHLLNNYHGAGSNFQ